MTLLANAPVAMMITWMVILIGSLLFGLAPGRTARFNRSGRKGSGSRLVLF